MCIYIYLILFQSNAKLKLVRSLAVCEESSGPFSTDGPPESVLFISVTPNSNFPLHRVSLACNFLYAMKVYAFWAILNRIKKNGNVTNFSHSNGMWFSRKLSSFTSAVRQTRRRRSPQRTSMRMKRRRRRTRLHGRCCHVVRPNMFCSLLSWAFCNPEQDGIKSC